MSSPAEELLTSEFSVERRFYQRTAPPTFVGVNLGDDNPAMLLNLSENGLLVATPNRLVENFVFRASLLLSGLMRPIEVLVRVVWTTESKRAGIQMLDLCEYDREQIRKWAALEEARRETAFQRVEVEDRTEVPEPVQAAATNVMETPAEETGEETAQLGSSAKAASTKRSSTLIPLAVCAGSALILLAMGAAVWASPLRPWLVNSIGDAAKYAKAIVTKTRGKPQSTREAGQLPASTDGGGQNLDAQTAGASETSSANSVGNGRAPEDGGAKEAPDSGAAKVVNDVPIAPAKRDLSESLSGKKSAPKKEANSSVKQAVNSLTRVSKDVAASSGVDAGEGQIVAKPSTAASDRGDAAAKQAGGDTVAREDDAKKDTPEGAATEKPATGSSPTNQAETSDAAVSTAAESNGAPAHPRTSRPSTAVTGIAPSDASKSSVVQTESPKSQVYEITLPNSTRPSFLSLPGERVVQADGLTLHLQRSILTPPGAGWWNGERRKKVVVGGLLTRVDPQLPRQAQAADVRVSVRAILGKDGRVERLMPVNGSVALVSSVTRAVREWTFQPTLVDGKPVETAVLVLAEFHAPASGAATH